MNINYALQIDGWMSDSELRWLAAQAESHNCIVELGSYLGRSSRAFADNTKGIVYCVDAWSGDFRENPDMFRPGPNGDPPPIRDSFKIWFAHMSDRIGRAIPLKMEHKDAAMLDIRPDMVFIDGDHSYEGCRRDIEIWKAKLVDGGLLCGHDASWEGVQRAWTELLPGAEMVECCDIFQWTK